VKACLADRVPGGPPPILTDCSAAGLQPEIGNTSLPDAVAEARLAVVEAAVACDYDALKAAIADQGPYLGDGITGQADRAVAGKSSYRRYERWILPCAVMSLGLAIVSFAPLATKEFPELHAWLASWMMPTPK